jgi:methionine-rich copper-binding protein CopC
MKRTLSLVAAAALIAVATTAAWAHAFLDRAVPGVGSAVPHAPAEVKLWFTQALEPAFSDIEVTDADGRRVDKGDGHVDGTDRKLLLASLEKLPAGTYTVIWRVLSVDSHRTTGDFKFTVTR